MPRQSITDIRANEEVQSTFLLGMASLQQSRNGPYWRLELRDATGSVEAKIWSPLSTSYPDLAAGQMVEIRAKAGLFRDQIQVTIDHLRVLSDEERTVLDLSQFMRASPRVALEMMAELEALCDKELTHTPWRTFAAGVLGDPSIRPRLLIAPAAKSVHHAYVGGLLEHILSVAGLSMRIADHYPEIDRQVLLAGALFHDIGKLDEMSGGMVNDYTDSGRFLGHIVQGLIMLEPYLAQSGLEPHLALHFRHLLASHHGTLEFGSPREPATAEAFVLHYADNIDAKLAQLRGLFPATQHEDFGTAEQNSMIWSPWQNLLNRQLCRAVPSPRHAETPKADPEPMAEPEPDPAPEAFAPEAEPDTAPDAALHSTVMPEPAPEPLVAQELGTVPEPNFTPDEEPAPELESHPLSSTAEKLEALAAETPKSELRPPARKELQCSLL